MGFALQQPAAAAAFSQAVGVGFVFYCETAYCMTICSSQFPQASPVNIDWIAFKLLQDMLNIGPYAVCHSFDL